MSKWTLKVLEEGWESLPIKYNRPRKLLQGTYWGSNERRWPCILGRVSLQLHSLQMVALWGTLVACRGLWVLAEEGLAQFKVEGRHRVRGEQRLPGGRSRVSGVGGRQGERPHRKLWGEQGSVLAGRGVCVGGRLGVGERGWLQSGG